MTVRELGMTGTEVTLKLGLRFYVTGFIYVLLCKP